ncbi:MAG: antibiotic biosynthesis monooxygenase [Actinobacteria bacterium]|nr:antibiotic biosynthesis monooxygenase [Actinomycetota bacterium]
MFVNIAEFPPIKPGKEEEFKEWFAWSNGVFEGFDGFVSRSLLKSTKEEEKYIAILEFESEGAFMAMHMSKEHQEARAKVDPLFEGSPTPHFYEVISIRRPGA